MISLTRINGSKLFVNPDSILWIETNPDTSITFLNGVKIIVKEPLDDVLKIIKNNPSDAPTELVSEETEI